ncbi:PAS domain S-box-containing protein [Pseudoduganella lurida]|uniref:histidine kinase n=2 Tax=Pseudoduganella lurida TaxID=1036180 RepID=A0A562RAT4_9BURK|nr:PAS domain S-box-containing protein [Pseudoduganella lurida]
MDCIKIIDLDGLIQKVNPGAVEVLELADASALLRTSWDTLWPDESRELVARSVMQAARGERSQFVAFCPTARGAPRWWDVAVTPVLDTQGAVKEIMAISRDITELHMAQEALREADRRKDEFLVLLAHELRNPLSAASMAVNMLQMSVRDDPRLLQLGQVVSRQSLHMSTLVEDLVDLDRVARGEVALKREPVDMRAVVAEAIEQVQPLLSAKRHTLVMNLAPDPCVVHGDRARLIQAVGNLVGNAGRYTHDEGTIQVSVENSNGAVLVTVADNGIGIAAEHLAGIFERYKQIDPTSDRKKSGLGLGLTLVSKLAELHGGKVTALSAGENEGSSFILQFPAAA